MFPGPTPEFRPLFAIGSDVALEVEQLRGETGSFSKRLIREERKRREVEVAAEKERQQKEYDITWNTKPFGFTVEPDSDGKHAFVCGFNFENHSKGLKLDSQ